MRELSSVTEVLVGLVMLVGLVGILLPVLPGLLLIWATTLAWVFLDGGGPVRITVAVLVTGLAVAGTAAKYLLPARSAGAAGAPRSTQLIGALCAVVGFFVIPVVGLIVGGVGGIFLAELARLSDPQAAWRSTRAVLVGVGIGALVELLAGVLMVLVWLVGVLAT